MTRRIASKSNSTPVTEVAVEQEMGKSLADPRSANRVFSWTTLSIWVAFILVACAAQAQHRLFVTSTSGSSDFSTWDDADGETGIRAADAICRAHAEVGGLASPQSYVAWISDSGDDAYCRIHGLSGKKSSNCGQAELPIGAGPWLRQDGFPFSGKLEEALAPVRRVLAPVAFDETGAAVAQGFFTGTSGDGTAVDLTCSDWTSVSNSAFVTVGDPRSTGESWTTFGATICSAERRLLCMRSGSGPELPPFEQAGAKVFVTTDSRQGDLSQWPFADGKSGIAAGDAICRREAEIFDFHNADQFKAWLSDDQTDARDRFDTDGPWVRADGVPIASSLADLVDGSLFSPLNLSSNGTYLDRTGVWTGTDASGIATESNCSGWTSVEVEDVAHTGTTGFSSGFWTSFPGTSSCASGRRLLCFEDAPQTAACQPNVNTLCLGEGNRFSLTVEWETKDDEGTGQAVDIGKTYSGLFTFFDPNNLELLVKVLPGCSLTGHHWVFYGATTDQGFKLLVTDTQTGLERVYSNSLGVSAPPVKDFEAFPCE